MRQSLLPHLRVSFTSLCTSFSVLGRWILGPSSWEKLLDIKVGKRQSPIDIVQAKATFDGALKNLKFSYPNFDKAQLQNNGHTIVFSPREEGNTSGE